MPVSHQLTRLLELRKIEEQDQRTLLGLAMAQLHQLQTALELAWSKEKSGRALVRRSVFQSEAQDRYIGLLESLSSSGLAGCYGLRIEQASAQVAELRAELLRKHREREQIQILIRTQSEREIADSLRRLQSQLDEWARSRWSDACDSMGADSFSSLQNAAQSDIAINMRGTSQHF